MSYTQRGPFLLGDIDPSHSAGRQFFNEELTLTVVAGADCLSCGPHFIELLIFTNIDLPLLYTMQTEWREKSLSVCVCVCGCAKMLITSSKMCI